MTQSQGLQLRGYGLGGCQPWYDALHSVQRNLISLNIKTLTQLEHLCSLLMVKALLLALSYCGQLRLFIQPTLGQFCLLSMFMENTCSFSAAFVHLLFIFLLSLACFQNQESFSKSQPRSQGKAAIIQRSLRTSDLNHGKSQKGC